MIRSGRRALRPALNGALLTLALVGACGRPPPLVPVSAVVVRSAELAPTLEEAGLDGRATVEAAREALVGAGLAVDVGARRSYRAAIELVAVSVLPTGRGGPPRAEIVVSLELEPSWASGPIERRSGRASEPLTGGDRREAWRKALEGAIAEAARAVALDLRAQQRSPAALIEEVSDADPSVRQRALRTLTARGAPGGARAAAGRIHDPDQEVARAAVDALVAFKDPSTVLSLIEAAQSGSVETTIRLIPVLRKIGGPDVEGYLLTLQSGHGDRDVRQAATDALARPSGAAASRSERKR